MSASPIADLQHLAKAEGARGGHVIGHTKSGKPVYGSSSAHYTKLRGAMKRMETSYPTTQAHLNAVKAVHAAHEGWSADDHRDAGRLHQKDHELAAAMPDAQKQKEASRLAGFGHDYAAAWLGKSVDTSRFLSSSDLDRLTVLAKAEGARGGHIIGHTRSGKPIYEAKGTKRELLHKLDHGLNHTAVASSLKHKHYIGMTSQDHFNRAGKHQTQAVAKFKSARKATTVKEAVHAHRAGQQHMSLSRAHAMMGQLSADVRMPDHLRDTSKMGAGGEVDKGRLAQTKERYFSTLGKAGHSRALSRHTRLRNEAAQKGHEKTVEHHDVMANAHRAILQHHYGEKSRAPTESTEG